MQVRSGETPRSPVVKPPCVVERPGSKRGGANDQSVTSREACSVVTPVRRHGGAGGAEPLPLRAKAMDDTRDLGAGVQEPPGAGGSEWPEGCPRNWRDPPRPRICGPGSSPVYNR